MIVFACIAPHGDLDDMPELRTAMEELGRRFDDAAPDVAIVVTPHNVHVQGHFAVVTAAHVGEWETDRDSAEALLAAELPILGVSYGGNVPEQSEMPLDWGTEVPLRYVRARRTVVIAPARDRALEEHIRLGELLREHSLIASADHGHAHDADGPYGFHPAAAEYDRQFQELVPAGDFRPLAALVGAAKADSLWQLLVLQGAAAGRPELLAYAAPTYYGMAVATVG